MTNQPSIAIIANGQIDDDTKILLKLKKYSYIIAADGGATHCLRMGIIPDLIMGDLDSISKEAIEAFEKVPKLQFLKDKDETDLELAINQALLLKAEKISLFAATGNRVDHTLVNLHFLRKLPVKLMIETENETIFALNPLVTDKSFNIETLPGQTISILPIGKGATGVTTRGLKWELNDATIDENFLSISNVSLSSSISISIKSGDILCFLLEILS